MSAAAARWGAAPPFRLDALKFLRSAAGCAPDALINLPLESGPARELETAHRRLINLHLDKELKSARVLRQLR